MKKWFFSVFFMIAFLLLFSGCYTIEQKNEIKEKEAKASEIVQRYLDSEYENGKVIGAKGASSSSTFMVEDISDIVKVNVSIDGHSYIYYCDLANNNKLYSNHNLDDITREWICRLCESLGIPDTRSYELSFINKVIDCPNVVPVHGFQVDHLNSEDYQIDLKLYYRNHIDLKAVNWTFLASDLNLTIANVDKTFNAGDDLRLHAFDSLISLSSQDPVYIIYYRTSFDHITFVCDSPVTTYDVIKLDAKEDTPAVSQDTFTYRSIGEGYRIKLDGTGEAHVWVYADQTYNNCYINDVLNASMEYLYTDEEYSITELDIQDCSDFENVYMMFKKS